jgi:hypothetical protein
VAKVFDAIDDTNRAFIEAQQLFFVATAPLSANGHANLSPKALDAFRVLSPTRVAYLDLTGSGNETSAHLRENGRITFMFCAFAGPPKILRLYGRGETVLPSDGRWAELLPHFGEHPGARQIIVAEIDLVQTSCGFGVPLYAYVGQRDTLTRWAEAKGDAGLESYRAEKNAHSIDGLVTPLGETRRGRPFEPTG